VSISLIGVKLEKL